MAQTKRLSEAALQRAIYRGARNQQRQPCSYCADGGSFADFPHFHGSDFGRCPLKVQYKKLNPSGRRSDQDIFFLSDGHIHERSIVDALRAAGHTVDHREDSPTGIQTDEFVVVWINERGEEWAALPVRDVPSAQSIMEGSGPATLAIVGHTDGVLDGRWLLEMKSVKDWAVANKFAGKWEIPAEYAGQMQAYINSLGLEGGYLIPKSRHTSRIIRPKYLERDEEFMYEKLEELHFVQMALGRKEWVSCNRVDDNEPRFCEACKVFGRPKK